MPTTHTSRAFLLPLLAVLLSLAIGVTSGAKAADENGDWWNSLTKTQKAVFMDGFLDGIIYGYKLLDGALLLVHPKYDRDYARPVSDAEKLAHRQLDRDFGNRTWGQYVAGLDTIYADYRNTTITVSEAIIVVARSLDGTSDDEIAKLLERKRKEASK